MWIKVVPDANPNADGRWIEVAEQPIPTNEPDPPHRAYSKYSWLATAAAYEPFVPDGEHLVAVNSAAPSGTVDSAWEDRTGESMHVTMMRNLHK